MTRFSTEEIINQINARLPDNSNGQITPAVLRGVLNDVVMSLRSTGAYIAGTTGVVANFASAAYQQVAGLYTFQQTRDDTEITVQMGNGTMTALYASDFNVKGSFSVSGAANERFLAGIAVNGIIDQYFKVEEQMAGAGNTTELNIDGVVHLNVNDTVAIWFSSPTFPAAITISNAAVTATLLPSRV